MNKNLISAKFFGVFLLSLIFLKLIFSQYVGPYQGDVPLSDTLENYYQTLSNEFNNSIFVSTYLYPKVLYQDSRITISRQVDMYSYERVTTHIGGYTRKLNITYYKVHFLVKNNHKLPLKISLTSGKFSKYWVFLEVDPVIKDENDNTYTWTLYVLPNEEKSVSFGSPYYVDSELTVIRVLTAEESFDLNVPSNVKQNEKIELTLTDSRGTPLQNVEIIVLTPSQTSLRLRTDETGKASFTANEVGMYSYEVFGSYLNKRTEVTKTEVIDTTKKEENNTSNDQPPKSDEDKDVISNLISKSTEKMPKGVQQIIIMIAAVILILLLLMVTYSFFSRTRKREKLEEEDLEERIERDSFVYSFQKDTTSKQSMAEKELVEEKKVETSSLQSSTVQKREDILQRELKVTYVDKQNINEKIEKDTKEEKVQQAKEVKEEREESVDEDKIIQEVKETVSSSVEEEDTESLEEKLKRIREIVKELHEESEQIGGKKSSKKEEEKQQTSKKPSIEAKFSLKDKEKDRESIKKEKGYTTTKTDSSSTKQKKEDTKTKPKGKK